MKYELKSGGMVIYGLWQPNRAKSNKVNLTSSDTEFFLLLLGVKKKRKDEKVWTMIYGLTLSLIEHWSYVSNANITNIYFFIFRERSIRRTNF